MDPEVEVGMVGSYNKSGKYIKGIEDYILTLNIQPRNILKLLLRDSEENWLT